jgi:biopolymer transport protein ExbD
MAEINMVPFIDVMLVLLIIFMVTAPMITHQHDRPAQRGQGQQAARPGAADRDWQGRVAGIQEPGQDQPGWG